VCKIGIVAKEIGHEEVCRQLQKGFSMNKLDAEAKEIACE